MPAPVVVSDLGFVAEASLAFLDDHGPSRKAYFCGVIAGLHIAKVYSKIEVINPDPRFWVLLSGTERPIPDTMSFVTSLGRYTSPRFNFVLSWIPEQGLRFGLPGIYYSRGIFDATNVAIKQVPMFYRYAKEDLWKQYTLTWINEKIRWAENMYQTELMKTE